MKHYFCINFCQNWPRKQNRLFCYFLLFPGSDGPSGKNAKLNAEISDESLKVFVKISFNYTNFRPHIQNVGGCDLAVISYRFSFERLIISVSSVELSLAPDVNQMAGIWMMQKRKALTNPALSRPNINECYEKKRRKFIKQKWVTQ